MFRLAAVLVFVVLVVARMEGVLSEQEAAVETEVSVGYKNDYDDDNENNNKYDNYKPGGLGPSKAGDEEAQHVLNSVKAQVKKRLKNQSGKTPAGEPKVMEFSTQVVNGLNYFMKVKWESQYFLVRIYETIDRTSHLDGLEMCASKHNCVLKYLSPDAN